MLDFKDKKDNITPPPATPTPSAGGSVVTGDAARLTGSLSGKHGTASRLKINLAAKKQEKPAPKKRPRSRYEAFRLNKNSLSNMLEDASKSMELIGSKALSDRLKKLCGKVTADAFRIQIVGTFKNGKSTFINSFLGQPILPAYALPCTAVINEVRYGRCKRAVLYFKNPLPKELPQELSPAALAHMQKHGMKNVPPMEIPYDKIEDYVVIPMGKDPKDMLLESPYEKVVLYWPLELLKNGIQIIDSPGLNEHATRTKVTMDYLGRADAIIFVLNATALCALDEMEFIENNLKTGGFNDLFFVINRFDLIPENEREAIERYARIKLSHLTSFGDDGLYFLSARDALDAKTENDQQKLKSSGMADFERALSLFLTKTRGEGKLINPAREMQRILREEALEKMIPQQLAMLERPLEELKAQRESIKPKLADLLERKERLREKMQISMKRTSAVFTTLAERNVDKVLSSIPVWVNEYTPSSKIGVILSRDKVKNAAYEISSHLASRLEQNNTVWQETELVPQMKKYAERILSDSETEIKELMREAHLAGGESLGELYERDLSDYGISVNYAAIYGGDTDSSGGSDTFARKVAGKKLMVMLTLTRPAAMWNAFSSIFGGDRESSSMARVKQTVAQEMRESMLSTRSDFASYVANSVVRFYEDMSDRLVLPVNEEIERIESQMNSVIEDIRAGRETAEQKKKQLALTEKKIKALCNTIDKYIAAVSMSEKSQKRLD